MRASVESRAIYVLAVSKVKEHPPRTKAQFGEAGASVRLGGRGAGVTIGTSGIRTSIGIPATGLGYSGKIGHPQHERSSDSNDETDVAVPQGEVGRFEQLASQVDNGTLKPEEFRAQCAKLVHEPDADENWAREADAMIERYLSRYPRSNSPVAEAPVFGKRGRSNETK